MSGRHRPDDEPERLRDRLGRWVPSPHGALVLVAVAYCVGVVLCTNQAMTLTYDEVVYASQVSPDAPAARFTAPRARGMSLLVAPVVAVTQSPTALRVFLVVLAGLLMYVAFRPWLPIFERVGARYRYVPAFAAAVFGSLWITLLYGNLAYPNLWLTFALVAGVGYLVGAVRDEPSGWRPLLGVALAFGAATLLRPTDASAVAAPLLVALVVLPSWRRPRALLALGVGLSVGWAAWAGEAFARFGGPLARLKEGGDINESGLTNSIGKHLAALDGPAVLCRPASQCAGVHPLAALWWLLLPVLVVVGLIAAARLRWLPVGLVVTLAAATSAGVYLFLIDYAAPRFLLPAYGLLAIVVAAGAIWLTNRPRGSWRIAGFTVLAGGLVLHLASQVVIATKVQDALQQTASSIDGEVAVLRAQQVHTPCLMWGANAIQVAYQLGCRSIPTFSSGARPDADEADIVAAAQAGEAVVVKLRADVEAPVFLSGWQRVAVPATEYVLYVDVPNADVAGGR